MFKRILLFILVIVSYLLYVIFVINPQDLNHFSLIDDGQLIKYGIYLKECLINRSCIPFKTQIIDTLPDVGLSRSGSWLINGLLYQGPLINAGFQHAFRAYGLGLIMVLLLVFAGISAGLGNIAIFLGVAIFVTNYSFAENMIRLGPTEPYMVIFLGIFSLFFLNLDRFSKNRRLIAVSCSFFTLIYFLLLKEASIAILPAILVVGLFFPEILKRKVLITMLITSGTIYFLVKYFLRGSVVGSDYADNYKLNFLFIIQNSLYYINLLTNSLNVFFNLIIVTPFLLIFKKFRQKIVDRHLVYWFLMFASFTVILFPWKFVLDRYLLPAIFSFSIFTAILIGRVIVEVVKYLKLTNTARIFYNIVVVLILSNLFFVGVTGNLVRSMNYKNWFAVFTQFEADQVEAIARMDNTVYINAKNSLDNWEIGYEIPMHLDYFFQAKPEINAYMERVPNKGYIFTRSLMDPTLKLNILSKYLVIDSKQYYISQINPKAYAELFKLRPIQTFINPPLDKEKVYLFWEIRKIK